MPEPADNPFFNQPILNSPYHKPTRHWELDDTGQPTQRIVESRRVAKFITPIPKPRRQRGRGRNAAAESGSLELGERPDLDTSRQRYDDASALINEIRGHVDAWRALAPGQQRVTPVTARLLDHWRNHAFKGPRPFFCQVEAAETLIWLTEVAPHERFGKSLLDRLRAASHEANPDLTRIALKLATGAGKTTVMAMIIAWHTLNAVRADASKTFTKGFLIIAPGLTIKDRLRVLQPNERESYYSTREIVPQDLLRDMEKAVIVITNYHAFLRRERLEISKGGRELLQGRGPEIETKESIGQMIQRVMPELMGIKNILVVNDEAHHCYREKPTTETEEEDLAPDDREEAKRNSETARLWISGIEAVRDVLGVRQVVDLSATPFFLRGSGYAEGTLFPWTASDFSLMDAIECGIVKLPRVPVAENIPGNDLPTFRKLWEHIRKDMPKPGRGNRGDADPRALPVKLQTALEALYGHYKLTFDEWERARIGVPPCFIVVCQNTAVSKLVYDYISGFFGPEENGGEEFVAGRLELFRNFDEHGNPLSRPHTLLIDSAQLESGEGLDDNFRKIAAGEIDQFRRELIERGGQLANRLVEGKDIDDATLLREVMNTVGKTGQLGASIRCVVSVSMLTEGWDANTVTHVLGVRAFGTQLLCEQVIGRALRRQSYEINDDGLFGVEYADVLGIPFDFNAKPVVAIPKPPRETIHVKAIKPERNDSEIVFPRVDGYRVELPREKLRAEFNDSHRFELSPQVVGPTRTQNSGIIGQSVELTLEHLEDVRPSTRYHHLARHLLYRHWRDEDQEVRAHLFPNALQIVRDWEAKCLTCTGGTYAALLLYADIADQAIDRINAAITSTMAGETGIHALLDAYNPEGTTADVSYRTTKELRWETRADRCHVNWAVCDSEWEIEFCRVLDSSPYVHAWVKNDGLQFEVPYRVGSEKRRYRPDFLIRVDDGKGPDDPLHLIVEIKGFPDGDAPIKRLTMETQWIPGVNRLRTRGRWAFREFVGFDNLQSDFETLLAEAGALPTSPVPDAAD